MTFLVLSVNVFHFGVAVTTTALWSLDWKFSSIFTLLEQYFEQHLVICVVGRIQWHIPVMEFWTTYCVVLYERNYHFLDIFRIVC